MDLHSVLTAFESWPVEDRLRLTDDIGSGLLERSHEPGLTEEQMAELESRLNEDDAEPDEVIH